MLEQSIYYRIVRMPTVPTHPNIVERTAALLRDRPRTVTLDDIARATGVGRHWLGKFSSGEIKDPSASRIQTLYEHLSGNRLGE